MAFMPPWRDEVKYKFGVGERAHEAELRPFSALAAHGNR